MLAAVALLAGCGDDVRPAADGGLDPVDAAPAIDAGPKGDRWFLESGKILALREQDGLYLDSARAEEIDRLLERARAVDIDAEGIIFENLFARSPYRLDHIYLWSSDQAIQSLWEQGILETGDEELDTFVASLEPSKIEPYSLGLVQLWFARWVDIDALVARFEEFPYLDAYSVCTCMDGDDIEMIDEETSTQFTMYFKWGDCFSGCLASHWWEVMVPHDPDLPAELVGEGGDPLPPP